jgi:hypothetical protein
MERMERQQAAATSATLAQLHALIGQGDFLFFFIKILKFSCSRVFLSMEFEGFYPLLYIGGKKLGSRRFPGGPSQMVSGSGPRLGLVAPLCEFLNII